MYLNDQNVFDTFLLHKSYGKTIICRVLTLYFYWKFGASIPISNSFFYGRIFYMFYAFDWGKKWWCVSKWFYVHFYSLGSCFDERPSICKHLLLSDCFKFNTSYCSANRITFGVVSIFFIISQNDNNIERIFCLLDMRVCYIGTKWILCKYRQKERNLGISSNIKNRIPS